MNEWEKKNRTSCSIIIIVMQTQNPDQKGVEEISEKTPYNNQRKKARWTEYKSGSENKNREREREKKCHELKAVHIDTKNDDTNKAVENWAEKKLVLIFSEECVVVWWRR